MRAQHTTNTKARAVGVIHRSTRSKMTTVTSADAAPPRTVLKMSRCEMRWVGGELQVRFSAHELDLTPVRRADVR